ncbi:hypothetical protein M0R19_05730 [Candidatus Pacearchaeota archaeon]|nr:hypothetical protein [Candidatus Pacearchaeota archaeon]
MKIETKYWILKIFYSGFGWPLFKIRKQNREWKFELYLAPFFVCLIKNEKKYPKYLCLFCINELKKDMDFIGYDFYRCFKKNPKTGMWYEFCEQCNSYGMGAGEKLYYESVHTLAHIEFGKVSKNKIELLYNHSQAIGIDFGDKK